MTKTKDHLAQMMELLGRMPSNMAASRHRTRESSLQLARSSEKHPWLNYWPIKKVLMEKYRSRRGSSSIR